MGDIIAARSPHERRETFLKKLPITTTFLFGDMLWMAALARLFKNSKLPAISSVSKAIESAPKHLKPEAGKKAAGLYALSFLLNVLTVSGVIVFNNRWTTKKIQEEATQLVASSLVAPESFKTFQEQLAA